MREQESTLTALLPWQHAQFKRLQTLVSNARLPHGWLLAGVAGVGKLAFIRHFARYLFCLQPSADGPCGRCQDCHLFQQGTHPDWLFLQPELKQLKIEQVREAIGFAQNTAQRNGAKVIVIQPAEAMNHNAANALLKMLEEPPPATYFFLLSEQPGLLLATLRSRCQLLEFPVPSAVDALQWLQTLKVNGAEATLYLELAQGAPLHAYALAQQGAAEGFKLLLQQVQSLLQGQATAVQVAKKCEELGALVSIDYQILSLTQLLQALQTGTAPTLVELGLLYQHCQTHNSLALIRRLHTLLQHLVAARKTALASNNANPLLMAEAIFAEWGSMLPQRR
jgi:DNA polymerase III subunit delta'